MRSDRLGWTARHRHAVPRRRVDRSAESVRRGDAANPAGNGRDEPGHARSGGARIGLRHAATGIGRAHVARNRARRFVARPTSGSQPAPVSALEAFIVRLQRYLRGESVERDGFPSRLHALSARPKVPVDVAGTGKRVIALAARHAEGLTLGVGANPERIAEKVREAEAALSAAGRSRADFTISAYVNVAVNDRVDVARDIVRGGVAVTARFSGMHGGAASSGLDANEGRAVLELADRYDMDQHGSSDAPHARALPDAFMDRLRGGRRRRARDEAPRRDRGDGRRPRGADRGLARRRPGSHPAVDRRALDQGPAGVARAEPLRPVTTRDHSPSAARARARSRVPRACSRAGRV